jgi:hypothetical protein
MLAVSLDCPFVLCTLCWQFLWIVPSSCVPYVGSFSGLSLRLVYPMLAVSLDCPFVLCTPCWQFLWIVPSSCVPYVASFSGLSLRYSLTFIFNTRFFQTQTLIKSVRHWQVSGRVIVVQRKRSNVLPMFHVYQDDVRFVLYHLQCFISVILVIN